MAPNSKQFSARNDVIVIRAVHDVATDTSAETRKLEGKLDSLVNLVTQLAANQNPASIARVCGIFSSNDHHTSVCPSSQQSGVDEHLEAYAANTCSRPPQQQRQDTSVETRKLKGKLDALVNLVTQLVANQKPALLQEYVASLLPMTAILVSVLLRSNLEWMSILRLMLQTPIADHHISKDKALDREDGSQLLAVQGVHDVATDTSAETRKLEGKLDALVNLVTQLAANPKPASVARVYVIRSSNDHYTSVCHSSQQSGVDENPEAYAANTYSRPPQQQRQVT
ncbi:hypothetical protein Fmac_032918 [Flemingia macrophylla]|uniref:Uncharacterized protein n=1 Tax=Flemingia macrophylla TaxID=520843 RepID=A0ABD1L693_9FABA